jgi:hypothetical protein
MDNGDIAIAAILIAVVIYIAYHFVHDDTLSGFDTSAWRFGSIMDQGYFGFQPPTADQLSVYMPQYRAPNALTQLMRMPPGIVSNQ